MFGLSVHFFGAAHKHMQQCGLAPLQHLLMRRTLPSQTFCRLFLPFGQYAKANAVVHVFVRCFHIDSTVLTARASSCCQSLAITGSRESERPS